MYIVRSTIVY